MKIVRRGFEATRRAFAEFLTIPCLLTLGFILLAAGTSALDHARVRALEPLRAFMQTYAFRDSQATSDLLGTIAGSIITVTSITFSLLLLAVQQAAAALTPHVYDQFLRRRTNQVYFGFFVGLAIYTLLILVTVAPSHNPIFGASAALVLTLIALLLVILLLYTTINQMRPDVVIEAIHDHTLKAWARHRTFLGKTRRTEGVETAGAIPIQADRSGYVVRVDVDALESALAPGAAVEIALRVCIGSYVAYRDTIAELRATSQLTAGELTRTVQTAIHLEQQRDLETDPAYGVEQLATIGWTSVSTAKSNPSLGALAIHSLRDLLARWSAEPESARAPADPDKIVAAASRCVYDDNVLAQLLEAFESLAVVASESMQHQTLVELVRTFTIMFRRLPEEQQPRAEEVIRRTLSGLGDHVLTYELDHALAELVRALRAAERSTLAAQVEGARSALAGSIGKLGSRATRVSEAVRARDS